MATITSAAAGLASVGSNWVGGVKPAAGDIAVDNHGMTWDENFDLGPDDGTSDALQFGGSAHGKTMTINPGVVLTLRGHFRCGTNDDYTATSFNTITGGDDSGITFFPGSGFTYLFRLDLSGLNAKVTLNSTASAGHPFVWKTDKSSGGNNFYTYRGSAGFPHDLRGLRIGTATNLKVIDAGDSSHFGLEIRTFGTAACSLDGLYLVRASCDIRQKEASSGGVPSSFPISNVSADTCPAADGFNQGLVFATVPTSLSQVVISDTRVEFGASCTPTDVFIYTTTSNGDSGGFWSGNCNMSRVYLCWDNTVGNKHVGLISAASKTTDIFILDTPTTVIGSDSGDWYVKLNGILKRFLCLPIRTGVNAGSSPGVLHIENGNVPVTIQNCVNTTCRLGEAEAASTAGAITDFINNISLQTGLVFLDISTTPTVDAVAAAQVRSNLFSTGLTTGIALGISSTIATSGGTYNSGGQTVATITFKDTSARLYSWALANGASDEATGKAVLLANPSLVPDLIDTTVDGWLCTNPEANGTGEGSVDMGLGYYAAPAGSIPPIYANLLTQGIL